MGSRATSSTTATTVASSPLGWIPARDQPHSPAPTGWIGVPGTSAPPAEPSGADDPGSGGDVVTPVADVPRGTFAAGAPRAADVAAAAEGDGTDDHGAPPTARETGSLVRRRRALERLAPLERPGRPRVIVVANQKGGVGKTTTAVNLAAALSQAGAGAIRTLVLDLDPQGNASTALGVGHEEGTPGSYEVLIDGAPIAEVQQDVTGLAGVRAVPATIDLAGTDLELSQAVSRETRLRAALERYFAEEEDPADYVFIDCPPSLGLLTVNAMVAASELLIPIQCEYYALEGLGQLQRNYELIRQHLNPHLRLSAILLTMYDPRTRLAAQVVDEVRAHFGDLVLATTIPRSVRVSEAPSFGVTVLQHDPASVGAVSYLEAARELATMTPADRDSTTS